MISQVSKGTTILAIRSANISDIEMTTYRIYNHFIKLIKEIKESFENIICKRPTRFLNEFEKASN